MAELQIRLADGRVRKCPIEGRSIVIGRDPTCDIALPDGAVSRHHATVRQVAGEYQLEDLHSSNGTWLNGHRITSGELHHGDVITIHQTRIRFCDPGKSVSAASVTLIEAPASQEVITVGGPHEQPSLPLRRLEMIYELSGRLTSLRDANELLEDAMDICFETLGFERGAIAVLRSDGEALDWRVVRNLRGEHGEIAVSQTILRCAMQRGERSIVNDDKSRAPLLSESMERLGISSAMCVPLMIEQHVLGVIYGDRFSEGGVYSTEDIDFLFGLARQVTIGLINARLMEEHKRMVKLENQINLAREIQSFLLPLALPRRDDVRTDALNEPGEQVSGDYYDVIELDGGRLGLVIADVTGKGVAASLLMANLQGTVRATLAQAPDPTEALALWNNLVHSNTDGLKFITCLLAILDPGSRRVRLATAGHPAPYLLTRDPPACRPAEVKVGVPLGIEADSVYTTTEVNLPAGPCALFLYTDGVTEAMNAAWEEFDRQRLEKTLRGCNVLDPPQLIHEVYQAVKAHAGNAPQSDDITMLAVQL